MRGRHPGGNDPGDEHRAPAEVVALPAIR